VHVVVVAPHVARGASCSRRRGRIDATLTGAPALGGAPRGSVARSTPPLGDEIPQQRLQHVNRRGVTVGARVGVAAGELLEEDPVAETDVPGKGALKRGTLHFPLQGVVRIEGKENRVVRDGSVELAGDDGVDEFRRGEKEGAVAHPVPVGTVLETGITPEEIVKFELGMRVRMATGVPADELGRLQLVDEDDVDDLHRLSISNIGD
jgi:hypothetical protein